MCKQKKHSLPLSFFCWMGNVCSHGAVAMAWCYIWRVGRKSTFCLWVRFVGREMCGLPEQLHCMAFRPFFRGGSGQFWLLDFSWMHDGCLDSYFSWHAWQALLRCFSAFVLSVVWFSCACFSWLVFLLHLSVCWQCVFSFVICYMQCCENPLIVAAVRRTKKWKFNQSAAVLPWWH